MKNMRMAFISYEFPPDTGKGGIGTYVGQVALAMAAFNWDVHVFCGGSEVRSFTNSGYQVHRVVCKDVHEFRTNVCDAFALQHLAEPFNLIESAEINGNAADIKRKFPAIPLVVRLHAPAYLVERFGKRYLSFISRMRYVAGALLRLKWDLGYWRKYNRMEDADYRFAITADKITAPSAIMKDWAIKNWGIASEKIDVVPNIFDPPASFLNIPVCRSDKTIIFFGRLNVLKGLVNATRAMKRILKEYPGWHFKIIGDDGQGPEPAGISMRAWMQQELKNFSNQLSFYEGARYEDLPSLLKEGGIVILPGLFESFSYTCAEAMAAGKAVVGSRFTGMADLIEDKDSGMLADAESVNEIYGAVKLLIEDEVLRARLAENARKSIRTRFTSEKLSGKYKKIYESVSFS